MHDKKSRITHKLNNLFIHEKLNLNTKKYSVEKLLSLMKSMNKLFYNLLVEFGSYPTHKKRILIIFSVLSFPLSLAIFLLFILFLKNKSFFCCVSLLLILCFKTAKKNRYETYDNYYISVETQERNEN